MAASSGDGSVDRGDGRTNNQLRPLACELGLLHRADGSARFSHGGTSVLVAVNGPGGVGVRDEKPDRATVQVVWKPKVRRCGDAPYPAGQELPLFCTRLPEPDLATGQAPTLIPPRCLRLPPSLIPTLPFATFTLARVLLRHRQSLAWRALQSGRWSSS